jgi:Predicted membrane protein
LSIIIGYLAGGIIIGLAVATVVTFIALFFTEINIKNPLMTLFVIVMTAGVFSLAGLINAIFAKKFDDIAVIPSFVLAPLTYLGGVFYTVSLLPEFWQTLSRFNPILYMINSMRYSVIGISDVSIQNALMMIVVFFVLLFTTAVILLKKGIGIRQ